MSENQKLKITSYDIDWSDRSLKPTINVSRGNVDTSSTSISLVGYDVWNWGELFQENLIHMLENFAAATPPTSPTIGQIWYDVFNKQLKSYDGVKWIPSSTAYVGNIQPTGDHNKGDLWFDLDDGTGALKVWTGLQWDSLLQKDWAIQNFVNKNGDVMTGNLHIVDGAYADLQRANLRQDPVFPNDAVTKRYVDGKFVSINAALMVDVPAGTVMQPSYWEHGLFGWTATSSPDGDGGNMLGFIMKDSVNYANGGAALQFGTHWNPVNVNGQMLAPPIKVRIKDPNSITWTNWRDVAYKDEVDLALSEYVQKSGDIMTGSLDFNGNSLNMTANLSSAGANINDRFFVVTNIPNDVTLFSIKPNGTGVGSSFRAHADSNVTNSPYAMIAHSGSRAAVSSQANGTGVATPLDFDIGSTNAVRINTNTNVLIGSISDTADGKLQVTGDIKTTDNLRLTGVAKRIIANFYDTTEANRVMFQSGTANQSTVVSTVPNGTGDVSGFASYSKSTPNTSQYFKIKTSNGQSISYLESGYTGTAGSLVSYPITTNFKRADGVTYETARFTVDGRFAIGTASPNSIVHIKDDINSSTKITLDSSSTKTGVLTFATAGVEQGGILFDPTASNTMAFVTRISGTLATRALINANGNLLINTPSASDYLTAKLQVNGNGLFTGKVYVARTSDDGSGANLQLSGSMNIVSGNIFFSTGPTGTIFGPESIVLSNNSSYDSWITCDSSRRSGPADMGRLILSGGTGWTNTSATIILGSSGSNGRPNEQGSCIISAGAGAGKQFNVYDFTGNVIFSNCGFTAFTAKDTATEFQLNNYALTGYNLGNINFNQRAGCNAYLSGKRILNTDDLTSVTNQSWASVVDVNWTDNIYLNAPAVGNTGSPAHCFTRSDVDLGMGTGYWTRQFFSENDSIPINSNVLHHTINYTNYHHFPMYYYLTYYVYNNSDDHHMVFVSTSSDGAAYGNVAHVYPGTAHWYRSYVMVPPHQTVDIKLYTKTSGDPNNNAAYIQRLGVHCTSYEQRYGATGTWNASFSTY